VNPNDARQKDQLQRELAHADSELKAAVLDLNRHEARVARLKNQYGDLLRKLNAFNANHASSGTRQAGYGSSKVRRSSFSIGVILGHGEDFSNE
jgi:chromosome segregation ATPase